MPKKRKSRVLAGTPEEHRRGSERAVTGALRRMEASQRASKTGRCAVALEELAKSQQLLGAAMAHGTDTKTLIRLSAEAGNTLNLYTLSCRRPPK